MDRELYVPRSWTAGPDRCRAAGLGEETAFATKPELAARMVTRFLDAGHRTLWVAGDEIYGGNPKLRTALEERGTGYVLAVACSHEATTGGGKFRALHDLLRVYAAEQARVQDGEPGCRAAIGRMLDHYLHSCYDAAHLMQPQRGTLTLFPAQPGVTPEHLTEHEQALAWFKAEHHVLLSITALAAELGFDTCAWQLPWSMATFLDWQGHWHDWAATQRIALAAVTRHGDTAGQATARRAIATACARLADYDEAYIHLTECLRLYRQLGDRVGESRIHHDLSWLFEHQDRYGDALSHAYQNALSLFRELGDRVYEATTLDHIGDTHRAAEDPRAARETWRQALAILGDLGHPDAGQVRAKLQDTDLAAC